MRDNSPIRAMMVGEMADYFKELGFQILGAKGSADFSQPQALHNDGYGDQQDKVPDVLAYDKEKGCSVIGLVLTQDDNWEAEDFLTEYNVYLDQVDRRTGAEHRLYILVPPSRVGDFTAFITHYIHREQWHKLMIVSSKNEFPE